MYSLTKDQKAKWDNKTKDAKFVMFSCLRWLVSNNKSKHPLHLSCSEIKSKLTHFQSLYCFHDLSIEEFEFCYNELLSIAEMNEKEIEAFTNKFTYSQQLIIPMGIENCPQITF